MTLVIFFGGLGAVLGALGGALFPRRVLVVIGVGLALAAGYLILAFSHGCEGRCENWQPLTVFAAAMNAVAWTCAAAFAAFLRRRSGR